MLYQVEELLPPSWPNSVIFATFQTTSETWLKLLLVGILLTISTFKRFDYLSALYVCVCVRGPLYLNCSQMRFHQMTLATGLSYDSVC